ncbi:unnamed protein product, partial [Larinioides sclopetarius]
MYKFSTRYFLQVILKESSENFSGISEKTETKNRIMTACIAAALN